MATVSNQPDNRRDTFAYVSGLRQIIRSLETAQSNIEAIVTNPDADKVSSEGLKEAKQDIDKALAAITNELDRHPIAEYLKRQ